MVSKGDGGPWLPACCAPSPSLASVHAQCFTSIVCHASCSVSQPLSLQHSALDARPSVIVSTHTATLPVVYLQPSLPSPPRLVSSG